MTMSWLGVLVGLGLMGVVFVDAFEAMMLPRRVRHSYRLSRAYYRLTWNVWRGIACQMPRGAQRYGFLSVYGPLSLFGLLTVWAHGLIFGFAFLQWGIDTKITVPQAADDGFTAYLYLSGTTFFTLGYGDVVPTSAWGRVLSVAEAGIGFGFLAVVIGYLPVLYQAFSDREVVISMLDGRAGSPPTAVELLRRLGSARLPETAEALLADWERWAAQLLESHLSFPVLRYYRSQHDNQSWVATLTIILDTSALILAIIDRDSYQARLTFAMARHAAVDLGLVSRTPPLDLLESRLATDDFERLRGSFAQAGVPVRESAAALRTLNELRALYEPFINALGKLFEFELPPFQPAKAPVDNWQTSPWARPAPGLGALASRSADEEHRV
jgi:hypothetical protein